MLVQLAAITGHGHGMPGKIQPLGLVGALGFQHSIARFLGAAGLGDHQRQCCREAGTNAGSDAVDAVRIRVVEEVNRQRRTCRSQRIGHQLRAKRGATDAHDQHAVVLRSVRCQDPAFAHVFGKLQRGVQRRRNLVFQLRRRRQIGIAQPVMADHAAFVWIGNRTRLQSLHVRIRPLNARSQGGEQILGESHAAHVD